MALRKLIIVFLLAGGAAASLWPGADATAAPAPRRKVLIIYSWHDLMPWQAGVRAGLYERLQQLPEAERPEIYEERLDAARIAHDAAGAAMAAYLRAKYAGVPLAAVIGESHGATSLLARHTDLFPTAPRYAVNAAAAAGIPPEHTFMVKEDPRLALLAIPRVMPDCNRVVAVLDTTAVSGRTKDGLVAAAADLPAGTRLEVIESFGFDELYEKVRSLPPRSALLYFPVFQDRHGARAIPRQVLERLAAAANAPVFAHHDSFLGSGIVGGYLLSSRGVGALIAGIALGLPLPQGTAAIDALIKGYQFDDRQLRRWNIADARLPVPHEIIGREASTWQAYRWQVGSAALALVLEALLIAALVRALRQRRRVTDLLARERDVLAQRTAALEAANNELQDFSYAISHDLRSPLRAISGYAQIVAEEHASRLDPEGRRLLGRVSAGAVRMGQLIDSLVDFMLVARRKLVCGNVDMAELAHLAFEEQRAAWGPRHLRLEVGRLPPAWGDRALLLRVFENLIANAAKFIPTQADGLILLSGESIGGETIYHLMDNGVGFDMRYAAKLFRVFERLHAPGEFEGLGVGLAIVKRIVGRHGGRVWAEGAVGKGATIHLALPAMPAAALPH